MSSHEPVKVIPNQLYHDQQASFIDALFCCGKAQIYFPGEPLFLFLNGTDPLERIFGILRLKVKNVSLDYLTLIYCIGSIQNGQRRVVPLVASALITQTLDHGMQKYFVFETSTFDLFGSLAIWQCVLKLWNME